MSLHSNLYLAQNDPAQRASVEVCADVSAQQNRSIKHEINNPGASFIFTHRPFEETAYAPATLDEADALFLTPTPKDENNLAEKNSQNDNRQTRESYSSYEDFLAKKSGNSVNLSKDRSFPAISETKNYSQKNNNAPEFSKSFETLDHLTLGKCPLTVSLEQKNNFIEDNSQNDTNKTQGSYSSYRQFMAKKRRQPFRSLENQPRSTSKVSNSQHNNKLRAPLPITKNKSVKPGNKSSTSKHITNENMSSEHTVPKMCRVFSSYTDYTASQKSKSSFDNKNSMSKGQDCLIPTTSNASSDLDSSRSSIIDVAVAQILESYSKDMHTNFDGLIDKGKYDNKHVFSRPSNTPHGNRLLHSSNSSASDLAVDTLFSSQSASSIQLPCKTKTLVPPESRHSFCSVHSRNGSSRCDVQDSESLEEYPSVIDSALAEFFKSHSSLDMSSSQSENASQDVNSSQKLTVPLHNNNKSSFVKSENESNSSLNTSVIDLAVEKLLRSQSALDAARSSQLPWEMKTLNSSQQSNGISDDAMNEKNCKNRVCRHHSIVNTESEPMEIPSSSFDMAFQDSLNLESSNNSITSTKDINKVSGTNILKSSPRKSKEIGQRNPSSIDLTVERLIKSHQSSANLNSVQSQQSLSSAPASTLKPSSFQLFLSEIFLLPENQRVTREAAKKADRLLTEFNSQRKRRAAGNSRTNNVFKTPRTKRSKNISQSQRSPNSFHKNCNSLALSSSIPVNSSITSTNDINKVSFTNILKSSPRKSKEIGQRNPSFIDSTVERLFSSHQSSSDLNSVQSQQNLSSAPASTLKPSSFQLFLSQIFLLPENQRVTREAAKKADRLLTEFNSQRKRTPRTKRSKNISQSQRFANSFNKNCNSLTPYNPEQLLDYPMPCALESLLDSYSALSQETPRATQFNYNKTRQPACNPRPSSMPCDFESFLGSSVTTEETPRISNKVNNKCKNTQIQSQAASNAELMIFKKNNILNVLKEVKIDYSTKGDTFEDFLEKLTGPDIKLYNIAKVGTADWLLFVKGVIGGVARKKCNFVDVKANFDHVFLSKSQDDVTRYLEGDTKVYRLNIDIVKKVSKKMNIIEYIDKMAGTDVSEEMFFDTVISQVPLSSNYILDDDQSYTAADVRYRELRLCLQDVKDNEMYTEEVVLQIDKKKIMDMIYGIFLKVYQAFNRDEVPRFAVRNRTAENCVFTNGRLQLKPAAEVKYKIINFNVCSSRFKFCLMLFVLGKAYSLLENDVKTTKREIFYEVKPMVRSQAQVDKAIQDVCCLLNVGPWHLNMVSNHGLVYGDVQILLSSQETINCNVPGTLIPFDVEGIIEIKTNAKFILVVEKESIFHKLLAEDLPNKLREKFIMLTGKGMPDLNTQLFLKKLSSVMSVPIFILVDANVYGIRIMLNYRFGSLASSYLSERLAVPNARWLGVFPSDISRFNLHHTITTELDRKLTRNLLTHPCMAENPKILKQINVLLQENKKAEIESVVQKAHLYLSATYLHLKFLGKDYI